MYYNIPRINPKIQLLGHCLFLALTLVRLKNSISLRQDLAFLNKQLEELEKMGACHVEDHKISFHCVSSREEIDQTVSRYQAAVVVAEWFWTHSGSTEHSPTDAVLYRALLDTVSDVKEKEGEYERFLNATLYHIFEDHLVEKKHFSCCENRRWNNFIMSFSVDYHPGWRLHEIIEQAQLTQRRHWPWKTQINIITDRDGKEYMYLSQGNNNVQYMFNITPCVVCNRFLLEIERNKLGSKMAEEGWALLFLSFLYIFVFVLEKMYCKNS